MGMASPNNRFSSKAGQGQRPGEKQTHTLLTEVCIQRYAVLQVIRRGQELTNTFSRVVFREFVLVSTFLEYLYTI